MSSPFAKPPPEEQVLPNDLPYAPWDNYPVSKGHVLIVPRDGGIRASVLG